MAIEIKRRPCTFRGVTTSLQVIPCMLVNDIEVWVGENPLIGKTALDSPIRLSPKHALKLAEDLKQYAEAMLTPNNSSM